MTERTMPTCGTFGCERQATVRARRPHEWIPGWYCDEHAADAVLLCSRCDKPREPDTECSSCKPLVPICWYCSQRLSAPSPHCPKDYLHKRSDA